MVQDPHRPFLRVRDPWGRAPCSGGEGLSLRVPESRKGDSTSVRGDFPTAGMATPVMRVEGGSAPKPGLERVEVRYSRAFLLRAHGCLWLYPVEPDPGRCGPLGTRRSWRTPDPGEPTGSCMIQPDGKIRFAPKSSFFYMGGPSSLARSGGDVPDMGYMVSQSFCRWREPIVSRLLGRNWRSAIPGV
jgi:hypothetical protein